MITTGDVKLVLNTVFLAHGVIATSDWQYRDQRLALSLPAIDVLYNRERHYLFFNRCPWPILLTWYAIKFQPERRIIYAILIPLHPNQPLVWMYIFFLYFSVFSFSQRHLHVTLHTKQVCLYVILKFFKWLQEWLKTTEYSHNYDLTRICLELFLEQIYQCYCRISEL